MTYSLKEPSALAEYFKRKDEHAKRIADEVMEAVERRFGKIFPDDNKSTERNARNEKA